MATAAVTKLPPLPAGFTLDEPPMASAPASPSVPVVPPLPAGFTLDQPEPAAAPVTWSDRAMAVPSGINAGIAGLGGLPVDTALNLWDLGKAGIGYAQSKITGKAPSEIFDPSDRSQYVGSSAWIADRMGDVGIATQAPRPDDTASRYIHAASSGIPGALTGGATAPNIARQAVAGIASGVAAEGAKDLGFDAGTQTATALAIGAGVGSARAPARQSSAARTAAPTRERLRADAQAAYKRAEDAGVVVSPESFARAKTRIVDMLASEGVDPTLHPATTAAVKRIVDTNGPVTLEGVETLRKIAKSAESTVNPADRRLAGSVIDELDDYMGSLADADVTAGDARMAVASLNEARGLWARQRKTEILDELINRAELSAPNFSASGMENALRTEFRALAKNERRMRGFTPEEQQAIRRVAMGGPAENVLRQIGKAHPGGIVSGALASGAGYALGGPAGALLVPAVGSLSRHAATRMTQRNVQAAHELVRRGPAQAPSTARASAPVQSAAATAPSSAANAASLADELVPLPSRSAREQPVSPASLQDLADFLANDATPGQRGKLIDQGLVQDGRLTAAGSSRLRELRSGEPTPEFEATYTPDEFTQPIAAGAASVEPSARPGMFDVSMDGRKVATVPGEDAARSLADDLIPAEPKPPSRPTEKPPYPPLQELLDELGMTAKGAKPGALADDLLTPPRKDAAAKIPRAAEGALNEVERGIETRLAERIAADYDGAAAEYSKLKDSANGRILNTDLARELSPEYRADRTLSSAVHEPASHLVKQMYVRKLAEQPADGQDATVLFSAGGTGAGKSTALEALAGTALDRAQIIYDTNMNTLASADKRIQQALDAEKNVSIMYVWRDPVDSLVNGALPRAMRMGRTVPIEEHAKTHVGAAEVVKQLAAKYQDDPRVSVQVIDNSHGRGGARLGSIDEIPELSYDSVREQLAEALEAAHREGAISDAVYRGTKGEAGEHSAVQGLEQGRQQGHAGQPQPADSRRKVRSSASGKSDPDSLADELVPRARPPRSPRPARVGLAR